VFTLGNGVRISQVFSLYDFRLPDNYTVCRGDEPVSKSEILPARAVLPVSVVIAYW